MVQTPDRSPVDLMPVPTGRIVPKPHLRILARHNLSRQFQYEQRHMALKVTEESHALIKQICEAWDIGIPVYLSYAIMAQLERDTGRKFKWLDPATGERTAESEFPDVRPVEPAPAEQSTPTALFDPLSAL